VSPEGELTVNRLDVAFDCGSYMNLDAVLAQIEGATIHGYNMVMNETLSIENGRILEGNFDQYRVVRMHETPLIRVHTGAISGHDRFGEIGEAAIGPVGPAICSAIYKITGKRLRSTPIRSHDLSWEV
jgi:isoquinoline 1-oxidoreductase beta subunit